jgi:hypothetical protein
LLLPTRDAKKSWLKNKRTSVLSTRKVCVAVSTFFMQTDRRRRVFQVHLDLYELLAVPDSTGVFHVKVKAYTQGLVRQHVHWRGFTSDRLVENHRVVWNESLHFRANLSARSTETETLLPYLLRLKVKRTIPFGRSTQTDCIGELALDLAQYAGIEGSHTTRLPLEKTTTNALLRFTLTMRQAQGSSTFQRHGLARHILSLQASSEARTLSFNEELLGTGGSNESEDELGNNNKADGEERTRAVETPAPNRQLDAGPTQAAPPSTQAGNQRELELSESEMEAKMAPSWIPWSPAAPRLDAVDRRPASDELSDEMFARQRQSPNLVSLDRSSPSFLTGTEVETDDNSLQYGHRDALQPPTMSSDWGSLPDVHESKELTLKSDHEEGSSAESMSTAPEESSFDEQPSSETTDQGVKEHGSSAWLAAAANQMQSRGLKSSAISSESALPATGDHVYRQARFAARLLGLSSEDDPENLFDASNQALETAGPIERAGRLWRNSKTQSVIPQLERSGLSFSTRPKTTLVSGRRQHSRSSSSRGRAERSRAHPSGSKLDFSVSQILDQGLDKYVAVLTAEMRHERLIPNNVRETRVDAETAVAEVWRRVTRSVTMTPTGRRSRVASQRLDRSSNASLIEAKSVELAEAYRAALDERRNSS